MAVSLWGGLRCWKIKYIFNVALFLFIVIGSGFFDVHLSRAYVPSDLDFVPMEEETPQVGRLFVDTEPSRTTIKILNIKPRFYQGIELPPGKYHVAVSAVGCQTQKKWISLAAGEEKSIMVRLVEMGAASAPMAKGEECSGKKAVVRAIIVSSIDYKMVYIPPGTFMMGSPRSEKGRQDNETLHKVTLTKGFYLGATEVSQEQWQTIMKKNPASFNNCSGKCPVENVSWDECQQFIRRLNQMEGTNTYRLPTEAEWEHACRAGTDLPFSFGECLSIHQANYNGYPYDDCVRVVGNKMTPLPAGSFSPNAWGLYDMHGNVWEYCQDWYGSYPSEDVIDPQGPSYGSQRVGRGGSWDSDARLCRSAQRGGRAPGVCGNSYLGFRPARSE